jgi:hypothetical protein
MDADKINHEMHQITKSMEIKADFRNTPSLPARGRLGVGVVLIFVVGFIGVNRRSTLTPAPLPSGEGRLELPFSLGRRGRDEGWAASTVS